MAALFGKVFGGMFKLTHTKQVSEEETRLISNIFHQYDETQKGYLTRGELKFAVASLFGYKPSKFEVDQMMENNTNKGQEEQGVGLQRFTELMSAKLSSRDEDDEIRQIFLALDLQCRGFLTVEDLRRAISECAPHMPPCTALTAFRELDQDCDGRISYKDFEFIMKYDLDD
ncbi:unnamed protein product [Owenia fusiformis]|uniref:EF-hand domain-containing protein n=1 Tax=Owenia fusiformis TaxID=6347 RepID=A0A8S4PHP0_OWEFU|nr:unnamed protein product [Owenia fusiformis]